MAVVLTILKILGIILLCIIGLILLIMLLVLFVPIRYKVQGQFTEEAKCSDVKVRWLFFRFLGSYVLGEGFEGQAKVGFITVKRIGGEGEDPPPHKPNKKKKKDKAEEPESEPLDVEDTPAEPADVALQPASDQAAVQNADKTEDTSDTPESPEDLEIFGDGTPETKQEKKERKKREKAEARARKEAKKREPKPEKPPEERLGYKIEQFRAKVEKKRSHIEQFFERESTKRTIERGKKLLIKIFKHLKPKKGGIFLHVGLSSAADTGMILGKMAWLYPVYGKWLFIEPNFYHKVFEAQGSVKGRIRIGSIAIPALIFYLRKDTRKTIKLAKKI
jgi:hypothetical protein